MGAGAGGYVKIQLLSYDNTVTSVPSIPTDPNSPKVPGLSRTSQLVFTPAETPTNQKDSRPPLTLPSNAGPIPGDPPAGKVALGGLTQDDLRTFNLYAYTDKQLTTLTGMGTDLKSDASKKLNARIAQEAHDAFGGDWAGVAVALGPAGGRFNLVAQIELVPHWPKLGAAKPFQIIPVVVAFGTDSFVNHYLLSLIVAQKTSDLVDTAVTQPYQ
jgi:hypothetical protein